LEYRLPQRAWEGRLRAAAIGAALDRRL